MLAQHLVQCSVQQVRGRVVAHDVVPARQFHFNHSLITDLWFATDNFADMRDQSGRRAADFADFDLPTPLFLCPHFLRKWGQTEGGPDGTRITDLPARFEIEAGLGQDYFHFVAELRFADRLPVHDDRENLAVYLCTCIGSYSTPFSPNLPAACSSLKMPAKNS